jgi:hypothetical protein
MSDNKWKTKLIINKLWISKNYRILRYRKIYDIQLDQTKKNSCFQNRQTIQVFKDVVDSWLKDKIITKKRMFVPAQKLTVNAV